MWLQRLKQLFSRAPLPADAREWLDAAISPDDFKSRLDELITRNEVELDRLQGEIASFEKDEMREAEAVRAGQLGPRSRKNALRKIQRVRRTLDGLEDRLRIHDANIHLLLKVANKIQTVEAMEMRGLEESAVESALVDFEAEIEEYALVHRAADIARGEERLDEIAGEADLESLEAEITDAAGGARRSGSAPEESEPPPAPESAERPEEAAQTAPESAREGPRVSEQESPAPAAAPASRRRAGGREQREAAAGDD